jgi:hypothetical protein
MIELDLLIAREGAAPNLVEAYERYEQSHQGQPQQHANKAHKHD